MAYPVKNTFIHFVDDDSDSIIEDESSIYEMRKSKSSPTLAFICPLVNASPQDKTQDGTTKKNSRLSCMSVDTMSTMDTLARFTSNTMPTLETLESLPSLCGEMCERQLDEPVDAEETFSDNNDCWDLDFEMAQRRNYSGEQSLDEASMGECPRSALLEARLHDASRSQQAPRCTTASKDALVKDLYRASQSGRSIAGGLTPTERSVHKREPMPSTSSSEGEHNDSIVGGYPTNAPLGILTQPVTTLMVCNLPCKLGSEGLRMAVDELGFAGSYDLIHVPRGYKNFMGYGFVNFKEPHLAARFMEAISNYTFESNTTKRAYCKVAASQSLKTNLKRICRGANYRRRAEVPLVR